MATGKSISAATRPGAKRITRATIEQTKLPDGKVQHDIFDTVLPGFGVRIGKRKRVYFVMTRQLKGGVWKQVRVTIGSTAELDLASARQQAQEAIERAKQGKDPSGIRSERQEALMQRSRDTYATVRASFLKLYIGRQNKRPAPGTLNEMERALSSDVFTGWAERPMADITERDIIQSLDQLIERGSTTMANRVLAYLRLIFKWAKARHIIDRNPTLDIDKAGSEVSRDRVLSMDELRAIWKATEATHVGHGDLYQGIVRILMLTGQRREEIGGMRWSEIVEDYALEHDNQGRPTATCTALVLPPERTKNGRKHIVPLSAPALEIIEARRAEQAAMGLNTELVFTSRGASSFSGWSKSKGRLDGRANLAESWRLHDLRRSFVTHAADKLRIAPHVLEAIVNHASGTKGGIAGVYNRAEHLSDRRRTLDAWADYLLRHVGEIGADNVVEMVRV
ncbi:hypothetical protein CKO42_15500 [Lamprobacter modestohalophilus]|uniref:DUF4102 domain-containing protein n=1 Tax=Lamprobacter modestohalophilus TaxID=1064514 RepID=A0A9X0WAG3_9GAMM|nr:site-specific integrase [Lamprobacter modestohalophilus]MBK1619822.1 hypothetical protein [Lamprobacter modestohalophilus]